MDQVIQQLIQEELQRQRHGIELIASENFTSLEVIQAMGTCLTNKYAEGYPGKRYYGGCEVVDKIEQIAIDRLCALFGAEYGNVQPHSGAQANAAVFLGVLQPGDAILGFDLSHGGHLSHGSPVNFSGNGWLLAELPSNAQASRPCLGCRRGRLIAGRAAGLIAGAGFACFYGGPILETQVLRLSV